MAKTVELLLTETVETLGIVGDVVKVRTGYARNFLLPNNYATTPSQDLIKSLQAKRAQAELELINLRTMRAETIDKLKGFELTLERSCNDQGILYGAVTQQELAEALVKAGFAVRPRDVRLSGAIKRVDNYDIHIKYQTELETHIKLHVKSDRVLAKDEKPDLDFDEEGNLVQKKPNAEGKDGDKEGRDGKPSRSSARLEAQKRMEEAMAPRKTGWGAAPAADAGAAAAKNEKSADKGEEKSEKSDKGEKGDKPAKKSKK